MKKTFITSDSRIFSTYQKANYHENRLHLLKKMGKLGNIKLYSNDCRVLTAYCNDYSKPV